MARGSESKSGMRVDPRLLIGVGLVVASALGVWALVASLDDSREVYVATGTVTAGTTLDSADLAVERVRLGANAERYLTPESLPENGVIVTRTLFEGELVPASAVDDAERAGTATIVVPTRDAPASEIVVGALVDVWTAELGERGAVATPEVLVEAAEVSAVGESSGMSSGSSVELLVPREKVSAVLEALAAGDVIDLVSARPDAEQR
ncbi:hypothetical protein [Agromyces archimandritae]|uniref:SAF domain-containing protein n=1 Tax=Agromyces archimandritae TaxID=2781962 RepID=A0A975IPF5_9MICO|nr:hypothetical protein [Agromyces archimandritae]QTX05224.1 hypothetical protein G127AT_03055 [Agromyces archimandritae]